VRGDLTAEPPLTAGSFSATIFSRWWPLRLYRLTCRSCSTSDSGEGTEENPNCFLESLGAAAMMRRVAFALTDSSGCSSLSREDQPVRGWRGKAAGQAPRKRLGVCQRGSQLAPATCSGEREGFSSCSIVVSRHESLSMIKYREECVYFNCPEKSPKRESADF
jgi:hypothetical protein